MGRIGARGAAAAVLVAVVAACSCTGCAYSYDDGLAPLGQRESAASAAAAASASAAASAAADQLARQGRIRQGLATAAPFAQLLAGPPLTEWAELVLPDDSGPSLAFATGSVTPSTPARMMGVDADPGPATLHFACRGIGRATVDVAAGGSNLLSTTFACNRAWSRALDVPAWGHVDIQFSSAGDASSNVAFRLTRG
ncbi:hypothetical protein [Sinomonas cellulolyticus]|uniref:Lipoprotein n=1 Tax=Sinomonas cellulolyticus TaxID=2801916 RepID=A0ABS1K309_9MICC|nr:MULTISPECIES: hypothetical protein [Sinomonas]MBL0705697.1 hypothetical protein [Sinomonas cellulolyticus]